MEWKSCTSGTIPNLNRMLLQLNIISNLLNNKNRFTEWSTELNPVMKLEKARWPGLPLMAAVFWVHNADWTHKPSLYISALWQSPHVSVVPVSALQMNTFRDWKQARCILNQGTGPCQSEQMSRQKSICQGRGEGGNCFFWEWLCVTLLYMRLISLFVLFILVSGVWMN